MSSVRQVNAWFDAVAAAEQVVDELPRVAASLAQLGEVLGAARQARAGLARLDPGVIERALLVRAQARSGGGSS